MKQEGKGISKVQFSGAYHPLILTDSIVKLSSSLTESSKLAKFCSQVLYHWDTTPQINQNLSVHIECDAACQLLFISLLVSNLFQYFIAIS